jgi:hypothetical protein
MRLPNEQRDKFYTIGNMAAATGQDVEIDVWDIDGLLDAQIAFTKQELLAPLDDEKLKEEIDRCFLLSLEECYVIDEKTKHVPKGEDIIDCHHGLVNDVVQSHLLNLFNLHSAQAVEAVRKEIGEYLVKIAKWREIPSPIYVGDSESTGGRTNIKEIHYLISQSMIDKLLKGQALKEEEE